MMKLKFFWIPAVDVFFAEEELNRFLAMHRIVHLEKQFAAGGDHGPGWSVCVEWVSGDGVTAASSPGKVGKVDYREILDEATFRIFSALRTWRKDAAAAAGVPIYTVATNEQLAAIAQERVQTQGQLEKIEGYGAARIAKHAMSLLEVCRKEMQPEQVES